MPNFRLKFTEVKISYQFFCMLDDYFDVLICRIYGLCNYKMICHVYQLINNKEIVMKNGSQNNLKGKDEREVNEA